MTPDQRGKLTLANGAASVNPLYYVTFTTATLCASFILFEGFNTSDPVNTLSLLSGFLVTFTGVYLLNLSRRDPNGFQMVAGRGGDDAIGTDMISQIQTRMSMEARRSFGHRTSGDREGLMRGYDEEEAAEFGLTDLAEDSDDEGTHSRQNGSTGMNGHAKKHSTEMHTPPRSGER